jgi:quinoprotein glucose dehydrogenase
MERPERRPDVDALRVFATYLLLLFHSAKVYDVAPFYSIKNATLSPGLGLVTGFIHQWHMPLFFLLAGFAAFGSLRSRGPGAFLGERAHKLLVPLAFGVLVLCVPIRYVEYTHGQFVSVDGTLLPGDPGASFLSFLPHYFTLDFARGGPTWSHLWFLAYLFTFSALALPLLRAWLARPASLEGAPAWLVWLPIAPLALIQITLRGRWPGHQNLIDDWANFSYYLLFFVLGFALAKHPALERAAWRELPRLAGAGLAAALAMAGLGGFAQGGAAWAVVASRALSAVAGWCLVLALLGLARRIVTRRGRALAWLAQSAFPVYVLHQLAVVGVAVVVTRLSFGIPTKLLLTLASATALTLAAYAFVVRPSRTLRWLLAVKPAAPRGSGAPKLRPAGAAMALSIGLASSLVAAPAVRAAAPAAPLAGWPVYGGDAGGSRFSPADEITPANVARLEVAWTFHTGDVARVDVPGWTWKTSFEATPVLDDGTLYFPSPLGRVFALDPETGAQRWVFDTKLAVHVYAETTSRGVALWHDAEAAPGAPCARRVFYAPLDARLFALDAATGAVCPGFGEGGVVDLKAAIGPERFPGEYAVTSPPAVLRDLVIVGSAVGDNQRTDAPRGIVRAFDARSGALRWSFDPIPKTADDPRVAGGKDWKEGSYQRTGGANAWSILSVDPERDLVFVPTGSASPDYYGGERKGDDRHANSVVALRGATGELVWAFQAVHHDLWDYDVPAQPVLVTLHRDGRDVPAVVQATKMGFLFVLDRETGAPLFPVEERAVPKTDVPGEEASPTQPFPTKLPSLVPQTLAAADAFGITPWDRGRCRDAIAKLRNEGLFTPPSLGGTLEFPSVAGGSNWGSVAFDEAHQRLYANTSRVAFFMRLIPRERFDAEKAASTDRNVEFAPQAGAPFGLARGPLLSPLGIPCTPPPWGALAAVDLAKGEIAWQSTLGTTRDITPVPISIAWGTPNLGGPLATAGGLVFVGAAMDDYLRAFDAATGAELWKGRLPAGGQATPMTFRLGPGSRQYVVIAAGGHGRLGTRLGDSLVAFALPRP